MKRLHWLAPVLAAVVAAGCDDNGFGNGEDISGQGPVIEEERPVGRFTVVSNSTLADVDILQGSFEQMRVRAQENLLPYIRTQVEGNVLRIYTVANVRLHTSQPIVVELDVRDLDRIESSGSGNISVPILDARRLEVVTSGSGDIDLPELLADSLVVFGSGSGDLTGDGNVIADRITWSGSGHVDIRDMRAFDADVIMSGSGPVTLRVVDRLRAVLSGSGSLRYYGNPTVQQTVTGSGRVERAGN